MTPEIDFEELRGALDELAYGARYGPKAALVEGYTREIADALDLLEALLNPIDTEDDLEEEDKEKPDGV